MKSSILCALLVVATVLPAHAQVITTADFLLFTASVRANAMGLASVASTHDDPLALSFNPARAGFSPNNIYFTGEIYPTAFRWLGLDDLAINAKGVQLGINWYLGTPERWLRFGFGYNRLDIDFRAQMATGMNGEIVLGTISIFEHADVFSFALGLRYGVHIALGLNSKKFATQHIRQPLGQEPEDFRVDGTANDLGLLVAWPVFETLVKPGGKPLMFGKNVRPSLLPAIGYSKSNIGDELRPLYSSTLAALPRVARLGVSVNAGLTLTDREEPWQLGAVEWIQEAEASLVRHEQDGSFSYSPFLGKIDLYKNVILGQGKDDVTIKRGWELTALELVSYRVGRRSDSVKTDGWEVRLSGLLKLYLRFKPYARENPFYDFLLEHVDIAYQQANWRNSVLMPETMRAIRVSVF